MENILLTLVVILLVLVLIMMIGLGVLGWKIFNQRNTPPPLPGEVVSDDPMARFHPEVRKRMEQAQFIKKKAQLEATCQLHPQEPSEGSCAICAKYFCANCLKTHRTLSFCRDHLNVFLSAQWEEAFSVRSTPDDPEAGVKVVDWKNRVWEEEGIPLYLETHYKIQVEGDLIESWIVLFSRENEKADIKKRLQSPGGIAAV